MKSKLTGLLSIFFLLFFCGEFANAQMAKIQALYLFQFAKNVGWPDGDADKNFVVAVLGDHDVAEGLREIAANKRIGNRKIEVREVGSAQDSDCASILYVSKSKNSQLASAAIILPKRKCLIVSGDRGQCANGAAISFFKSDDDRLGFEISERNVKRAGLSVTPKLINLGKSV